MSGTSASRLTGLARGGTTGPPVAGVLAWYDASTSSSVHATAGAVDTWDDLSGNGYHLTSSGTARPTAGTRTINGLPALDFDGSTDFMSNASFSGINGNTHTMYAVVAWDGSGDSGVASLAPSSGGNDYDSATSVRFLYYKVADGAWVSYYNGGPKGYFNTGGEGTTAHQLTSRRDGATFSVWRDGAAGTDASGATTSLTATHLNVGADHAGGAVEFFNGIIAEILFYATAHGTTDRGTVEAYLKAKWGTP